MIFRRHYIVLALVLGALTAIGTAPWPIGHSSFSKHIKQQFISQTGTELTWNRATISLLPSPRIELHQVAVYTPQATDTAADNSLLRAQNIQIMLKTWPLLSGHIEPDNVILSSPSIRWTGSEKPIDLWSMLLHISRKIDTAALSSYMSIIDGQILHENGTSSILRRLNASIAWPAHEAPFYASATAVWRGEPIDLRIEKLRPDAIANNQTSPLSLRFTSRPLSISFNGEISADVTPVIEGDLSMNTRSFGRALTWLGMPLSVAKNTGRFGIKGTARLSNQGFSIPNATIEVESSTLEGALGARITDTKRALISATLDTQKLDLSDLLAFIHSPVSGSGWNDALRLTEIIDIANDFDIRLSADQTNLANLELEDVAASILITGNKLEFSLSQARLNSGTIRARLQIAPSPDTITARLTGAFENIDANAAIQDIFGAKLLSGKANGQIALEGTGQSPENLARTLKGNVTVNIAEGNLTGIDLADVLKRARMRPLATALDWRGGYSPFTEANALIRIHAGIGELDGSFRFKGDLIGMLGGYIGIADRTLALHLYVNDLAGTEMESREARSIGFPIGISGSWDYPIVTPDIRMLIERSNATAPIPGIVKPPSDK